jgi:signal transduction protein with GAF and PtsI domain
MSRNRTTPDSPELAILAEATTLLSSATRPEDALQPLVSLVKRQMATDVCSLYLLDTAGPELVLAATDGLEPSSVGQVRMHPSEGLTGLVAEARAPVSVPEAARHPRYRYFPETGEERYHSFLGVPLLRRGEVEGVLIVQTREARRFRGDEVRLMTAISAQLAGLLADTIDRTRKSARYLSPRWVFPAVGAQVGDGADVVTAVPGRPQALCAAAPLADGLLEAVAAHAPGVALVIACEEAHIAPLLEHVREVARMSPIRLAVGGLTEPGEMLRVRREVAEAAGRAADVTVGALLDAAAAALSVRALGGQADFFLLDSTALARSALGGRSEDPFVPAVLRLVARALHAARESGRPSFLTGALAHGPEGWVAAAGFGADVVVAPAQELGRLRRFGPRFVPAYAAQCARSALKARGAAEARSLLLAEAAREGQSRA